MKLHTLLAASILFTAGSASADLKIYNTTPAKLRAEVTTPNGKVRAFALSEAVDSVTHESWQFSPGVTEVKVALLDDTGTSVWTGTAGPNDVKLVVGTAKGVKLVQAGIYGGSGAPRAAAFINLTGDAITLDLEGNNGLASHRGITPGADFDLAKLVKLDAREAAFTPTLTVKGADPTELDGQRVNPGYQYAVWKTGRGAYRVLQLGNLPPPPTKKAKK